MAEFLAYRILDGKLVFSSIDGSWQARTCRVRGDRMEPEIAVAICSLIGTLVGSLAGIMTANRLTNYRIEQLEEKVRKHNNLVERMIVVEQSTKSAHHRLDELIAERED